MVLYVNALHHIVDPDMCKISIKKLEESEWCKDDVEFEQEGCHEHLGFPMRVS